MLQYNREKRQTSELSIRYGLQSRVGDQIDFHGVRRDWFSLAKAYYMIPKILAIHNLLKTKKSSNLMSQNT